MRPGVGIPLIFPGVGIADCRGFPGVVDMVDRCSTVYVRRMVDFLPSPLSHHMTRALCHNRVLTPKSVLYKRCFNYNVIPRFLHPILPQALLSNPTLLTSHFEQLLPGGRRHLVRNKRIQETHLQHQPHIRLASSFAKALLWRQSWYSCLKYTLRVWRWKQVSITADVRSKRFHPSPMTQ